MGSLGTDQLTWLKDDLKNISNSTPVVVFAHIPLWTVYPDWGWGTDDSAEALSYLKRFGSVIDSTGTFTKLTIDRRKYNIYNAMSTHLFNDTITVITLSNESTCRKT